MIFKHIPDFVSMSPTQTVKLCDVWFEKDYNLLAKQLIEHKDLAFQFLNTVLLQNENEILEEYNQSIMTTDTGHQKVSKKYSDLLLLFVEILCEKKFKN